MYLRYKILEKYLIVFNKRIVFNVKIVFNVRVLYKNIYFTYNPISVVINFHLNQLIKKFLLENVCYYTLLYAFDFIL